MVVWLREMGANQPRLLRDPKSLPFGYIPPEGIKTTPPQVPAAEPAAESKEATPAAGDKDKPAPEADEPKDAKVPKPSSPN
jgi:hypothetical protein